METLNSRCVACTLEVMDVLSLGLGPLLARVFNVVGGHCVLSHQVILMARYAPILQNPTVLGHYA